MGREEQRGVSQCLLGPVVPVGERVGQGEVAQSQWIWGLLPHLLFFPVSGLTLCGHKEEGEGPGRRAV